jgi:hypothetical protein
MTGGAGTAVGAATASPSASAVADGLGLPLRSPMSRMLSTSEPEGETSAVLMSLWWACVPAFEEGKASRVVGEVTPLVVCRDWLVTG